MGVRYAFLFGMTTGVLQNTVKVYVPKNKRRTSDWLSKKFRMLFGKLGRRLEESLLKFLGGPTRVCTKNFWMSRKDRLNIIWSYLQVNHVRKKLLPITRVCPYRTASSFKLTMVFAATANSSTVGAGTWSPTTQLPYDSDSYPIMIDNCCSRCVTTSKGDFVGKTTQVNVRVNGVGGNIATTLQGTVRWSLLTIWVSLIPFWSQTRFTHQRLRVVAYAFPSTLEPKLHKR